MSEPLVMLHTSSWWPLSVRRWMDGWMVPYHRIRVRVACDDLTDQGSQRGLLINVGGMLSWPFMD